MAEPQETYTLDDLQHWQERTKDLAPPARLSVFGDPVAHSLSPQMHNAGLKAAGIDSQYVRMHIRPEELGDAFEELKKQDFIGTNVTIPHKAAALEHMDEVTEVARRIGAVNTVAVEDGQLFGTNTDGPGFERAIREHFSVDLKDLRVMILGAGGGAGKAVAVQCGMEGCERLVLVNRTPEKAQELAAELKEYFSDDRLTGPIDRLQAVAWEANVLREQLNHVDLIVNATSLGMKRTDAALIPGNLIQPHHLIYDMVYSPARTRLMMDAREAGARAENGLSMLLYQGAISFEFWFNPEAPVSAMREGLLGAAGQ